MYINQQGVSFYYEREEGAQQKDGETMRDYRLRTYKIFKVGT